MLKYLFPEKVYLLMGNHDIGNIEKGQVTLYLKKAEEEMDYLYYYLNSLHQERDDFSDRLLSLYLEFMNNLNVMAYPMTNKVNLMAVHGGLPRPSSNDTFEYLHSHQQFTDHTEDEMAFRVRDCLIWSDPSIQHNQPIIEKKRFKFYINHFQQFKEHMGIHGLIRGHQAMEDGFKEVFQGVHTIFSSGAILENGHNINCDTAYDFVTPKILRYNADKGLPLEAIDLNVG